MTVLTNESNLFQIELILRWARINIFKFFRQIIIRIFSRFDIGCLDDVVLFKLIEIFDSSESGNSISMKLYADLL